MELIAKKTFRMGSRMVTKGERFKCDRALGQVYLAAKHAEYPPREVFGPDDMKQLVAVVPITDELIKPNPANYETRVMTTESASFVATPRRRGRPRKNPVG